MILLKYFDVLNGKYKYYSINEYISSLNSSKAFFSFSPWGLITAFIVTNLFYKREILPEDNTCVCLCRCFICGLANAAARCSFETFWAAPTMLRSLPTWSVGETHTLVSEWDTFHVTPDPSGNDCDTRCRPAAKNGCTCFPWTWIRVVSQQKCCVFRSANTH